MAFAHGSNDVANTLVHCLLLYQRLSMGEITGKSTIAWWILPLRWCFGIVVGLATLGHKVMATVGTGITELTPSRGTQRNCYSMYGCSNVRYWSSNLSTTQTLVGGIGVLVLLVVSQH
ncbi:inorganic phosphate transporter [Vibrio chagasii]|nr:inorganic phosphate transporter [Vibrio chagasii]